MQAWNLSSGFGEKQLWKKLKVVDRNFGRRDPLGGELENLKVVRVDSSNLPNFCCFFYPRSGRNAR